MIIGIIFKDKFYDHSYFFIQFSSDTKIYITCYRSWSVRNSLCTKNIVFHLNPVIEFHVMMERKICLGIVGRGTWRTKGSRG